MWHLQNAIEDLDNNEREMMIQFHWTIDQYENADYYRLGEVMSAKARDDRAIDPLQFVRGRRADNG